MARCCSGSPRTLRDMHRNRQATSPISLITVQLLLVGCGGGGDGGSGGGGGMVLPEAAICEGGTMHMMECLFLMRLRATYSWPWANTQFRKSSPMRVRVYPWDLFLVSEYARRRGN